MDIVNKFLFLIVIALGVWIALLATIKASFSDSGKYLSLIGGWGLFTLLTCVIMETLANVLIQLYLILNPNVLESANFEAVVKVGDFFPSANRDTDEMLEELL